MTTERIDLHSIIEQARQKHRRIRVSEPGATLLEDYPKPETDQTPQGEQQQRSLHWINTSRWDSEPCPQREWAVGDRIPLRQVTLFSGEGAIGKSLVELMLPVAHVTGKDWLGALPEPGGAFYIGCED